MTTFDGKELDLSKPVYVLCYSVLRNSMYYPYYDGKENVKYASIFKAMTVTCETTNRGKIQWLSLRMRTPEGTITETIDKGRGFHVSNNKEELLAIAEDAMRDYREGYLEAGVASHAAMVLMGLRNSRENNDCEYIDAICTTFPACNSELLCEGADIFKDIPGNNAPYKELSTWYERNEDVIRESGLYQEGLDTATKAHNENHAIFVS